MSSPAPQHRSTCISGCVCTRHTYVHTGHAHTCRTFHAHTHNTHTRVLHKSIEGSGPCLPRGECDTGDEGDKERRCRGISGEAQTVPSSGERAALNPRFPFKACTALKTLRPLGQGVEPGGDRGLGSRFCPRVAFSAGKPGSSPFAHGCRCCPAATGLATRPPAEEGAPAGPALAPGGTEPPSDPASGPPESLKRGPSSPAAQSCRGGLPSAHWAQGDSGPRAGDGDLAAGPSPASEVPQPLLGPVIPSRRLAWTRLPATGTLPTRGCGSVTMSAGASVSLWQKLGAASPHKPGDLASPGERTCTFSCSDTRSKLAGGCRTATGTQPPPRSLLLSKQSRTCFPLPYCVTFPPTV